MEPTSIMSVSEIKVEDASDVIDLDADKTSEDIVYEWDAKVRLKFKNYSIIDSKQSLDILMQWYNQLLKEEAVDFEDLDTLKRLTERHIQFFKLYLVELNSCFVNSYLDNMEEILTFYCNVEVKTLPRKRKDISRRVYKRTMSAVCRKIICMLRLYLLNRKDRMFHVVIKIKFNLLSEESKDLLNLLYGKFLTETPTDKSDLAFCRVYILYQMWKKIRLPEEREQMDKVMYNMYGQTPDSIKTNETLKQILIPKNNSKTDTLIHLSENHIIISEEYFKFIKSKNVQEDEVVALDMDNINLHDGIVPHLVRDDEDEEFNKAYNAFVKTMSKVSRVDIKEEAVVDDDDDDCQIVSVSCIGVDPENTEYFHEIVDDDADIAEIIYLKKKDVQPASKKADKADCPACETSFLDSIQIPKQEKVPVQKVSSVHTSSQTSDKNSNMASSSMPLQNETSVQQFLNTDTIISSTLIANQMTQNKVLINSSTDTSITNEEIGSQSVPCEITEMEISIEGITSNIVTTKKTVVNTETQTDDLNQVVGDSDVGNCQCNEKIEAKSQALGKYDDMYKGGYYYGGLVTPPSDQTTDEHNTRTTESSRYPTVYADILGNHNSTDETDSNAKMFENNYLPSSAEESEMENDTDKLLDSSKTNKTMDLEPSSTEQDNSDNNEDESHHVNDNSNVSCGIESEPDIEPNAKKKHNNLNRVFDFEDIYSSNCDSPRENIVITEVKSVDKAGSNEGASENPESNNNSLNLDSDHGSHNCDTNIVSGRSLNKDVVKNLTPFVSPLDTNISISCTSSDACTPASFDNVPSRSPSPSKHNSLIQTPSPNVPCTSTDITVTSQDCPTTSSNTTTLNTSGNISNEPCPSPDITSTSVDVQDNLTESFSTREGESEENQMYDNMSSNVSETSDPYLNGSYGPEEYLEYVECNGDIRNVSHTENVSQSNIENGDDGEEIFIEDPVLMTNGEELSFILGDAIPVGTKVNITMDNEEVLNHSDTSSCVNKIVDREKNDAIYEAELRDLNEAIPKSPVMPLKELRIRMEKLDKNTSDIGIEKSINADKVMCTSSQKDNRLPQDEFTKFEVTVHSRWEKLKETHDLTDEILSGPVSKMNGTNVCVNPDKNFDLFESRTSSVERTPPSNNSSANTSGDVVSPAFEEIDSDDFRSYYEKNKNNMLEIPSVLAEDKIVKSPTPVEERNHHKENHSKLAIQLFPKDLNSLQRIDVSKNKFSVNSVPIKAFNNMTLKTQNNSVKRKRIAFADVVDSDNTITHSPIENTNNVLQSILKKPVYPNGENNRQNSKRVTRPRIPRRLINLKSLAQFNVKPNDPCIQGVPCVVIERLSDSEISQWLRVSEISRKVRLQKQLAQYALAQSMLRVDYDKQTSHINENDVVRFKTLEGTTVSVPESLGHWRSHTVLQSKSSRLDEGFCSNDLPYTGKKNGKRKRQNTYNSHSPQNERKRPGRPRKPD